MLHFRQCAPPPTGVLPQASQGLDKSIIQVPSRHLVQKGSVETATRSSRDPNESEETQP